MPIRRQRVDVALAHIQRKRAQTLNRIDEIDAPAAAADLADLAHGRPIAIQESHEADGEQPRALARLVDAVERIEHGKPRDVHTLRFRKRFHG